ncbi:MAG: tRNA pseudouridine(38-40) synthase TruA [Dehalococcoidia bacterium]
MSNSNRTDAITNGWSRLALVVEYEGTRYRGFQWQRGLPTIQGELEKALEKLTGRKTRVAGASRTDSGVHARGQVVSFRTESKLPPETFVAGLNYYLGQDIAVERAFQASDDFDVRRWASSRQYRYSILNRREPSPLQRDYTHQVREPLDVEAMDAAARGLIGTHDFASFAMSQEMNGGSTVRNVINARVTRDGDVVFFDVEANAFLQQQVRRTAGALVGVGTGKVSIEEFEKLMEAKTPGVVGSTLPAKGLCLVRVNYPESIFDNGNIDKNL